MTLTPVRRTTAAIATVLVALASVLALGAFTGTAGAQAGHGSNPDAVVGPPTPTTCDGLQWVGVTGQPPDLVHEVRLIYLVDPPVQTYTVPGMTVPAGTVDITEMITWDAYIRPDVDRRDVTQNDEQLRIEFYDEGVMVAATGETPDLLDGVASAWWVGPPGTVDLPNGADEVRLVHSSLYAQVHDNTNSIVPVSFCLEVTPAQEPTTTTTEQPAPTTTEPPAPTSTEQPVPTTTEAPATTTTVPTEVGGVVQTTTTVQATTTTAPSGGSPTQLAVTGSDSTTLMIAIGLVLVAIGLVLRDLRKVLD